MTTKPCKKLRPEEYCPIRGTIKQLGKKWTILIIKELYYSRGQRLGFMQLRKRLQNASAKVLSQRLKEMVKDQLIKRNVKSSETPLRVYYRPTQKGKDACKIIQDLKKYGLKWGSKEKFDCKNVDCELCEKAKNASI